VHALQCGPLAAVDCGKKDGDICSRAGSDRANPGQAGHDRLPRLPTATANATIDGDGRKAKRDIMKK